MISVWEAGIDEREPRSLKKDQSCQVLILGGNLAGLFAALFCMEKGYQVIVIEEGVLEERALDISFFDKITNLKTWAYSIWYPWLAAKYGFKCSFKRIPAYYYCLSQKPTARMPKQPVFHPVRWMREVSQQVDIYEGVKIIKAKEKQLDTSRAVVHFEMLLDARKQPGEEKELWTAMEGVSLDQGIYLCMDGTADFLMWKEWLIMRDSYRFLFPKGQMAYRWEIDGKRKEGIYESMERARRLLKESGL